MLFTAANPSLNRCMADVSPCQSLHLDTWTPQAIRAPTAICKGKFKPQQIWFESPPASPMLRQSGSKSRVYSRRTRGKQAVYDSVLKSSISTVDDSRPSKKPDGGSRSSKPWTFKKSNQANRHTDESSTAPAPKGSVSRKQKGDAVKSWSSGYSDQALNKAEIVRTHALGCRLYQ
jgi:hypothetical protein